MGTYVDAYLTRMRGCAARMGKELAPISERNRAVRLVEGDARSVERGFASGYLWVEGPCKVRTLDPRQDTVSLVAGDPPELRWEILPLLASYAELLEAGYPAAAVRFETYDAELGLDLAAVDEEGRALVVGRAEPEPVQLTRLEALVATFEGDPGLPGPLSDRLAAGWGAQKLAHQLWATRAPYLWLVAAGTRRVRRVTYGRTIKLCRVKALPTAEQLWPTGYDGPTPPVLVQGAAPLVG